MIEHTRKKRYEIRSMTQDGRMMTVDRFDLREQAELTLHRLTDAYGQMSRDLFLHRPRFALVDTWAGEAEGASEVTP